MSDQPDLPEQGGEIPPPDDFFDFAPPPWFGSEEGDPFPTEFDPLGFWGVPQFDDNTFEHPEIDYPEWHDFPVNMFGDPTEADYYIVDLANIPKDFTLRARVFYTLPDAVSYLRKAGVIDFSTVVRDSSGLYRVAVGSSSADDVGDEGMDFDASEIDF